jgi:hypothetical protein
MSQPEAAAPSSPAADVVDGCWGCDIQWEDEGCLQNQHQHQLQAASLTKAAHHAQLTAAGGTAAVGSLGFDAMQLSDAGALDWAYDEQEESDAWAAAKQTPAGAAAARPGGGGSSGGVLAQLAGKRRRRHEEIGAEIIKVGEWCACLYSAKA